MDVGDQGTVIKRKRGRPRLHPLKPDNTLDHQSVVSRQSFSVKTPVKFLRKRSKNSKKNAKKNILCKNLTNKERHYLRTSSSSLVLHKEEKPLYPKNSSKILNHPQCTNPCILAIIPYLKQLGFHECLDVLATFPVDTTKSISSQLTENVKKNSFISNSIIPGLEVYTYPDPRILAENIENNNFFRYLNFFFKIKGTPAQQTSLSPKMLEFCSTLKAAIELFHSKNKTSKSLPALAHMEELNRLFSSSTFFQLCVLEIQWENQDETHKEDILWDIHNEEELLKFFVECYVNDWHLPVPQYSDSIYKSLKNQIDQARSLELLFKYISHLLILYLNLDSPLWLPHAQRRIILNCSFYNIRILDSLSWNLFNPDSEIKNTLHNLVNSINAPKEILSTLFYSFLRSLNNERIVGGIRSLTCDILAYCKEFLKQNVDLLLECLVEFYGRINVQTTTQERKPSLLQYDGCEEQSSRALRRLRSSCALQDSTEAHVYTKVIPEEFPTKVISNHSNHSYMDMSQSVRHEEPSDRDQKPFALLLDNVMESCTHHDNSNEAALHHGPLEKKSDFVFSPFPNESNPLSKKSLDPSCSWNFMSRDGNRESRHDLIKKLLQKWGPILLRMNYTGKIEDSDVLDLLTNSTNLSGFFSKYSTVT